MGVRPQVVESLARALRVSDAERDVLFRLAGHAAPGRDVVPSRITASVQRLLDRLANTPVVVYDATWTPLMANAPYDALMGETSTWRGRERERRLAQPRRPRHPHRPHAGGAGRSRGRPGRRPAADRGPLPRGPDAAAARRRPRRAQLAFRRTPGLRRGPRPAARTRQRKTIDHPAAGHLTLACDILVIAADDLRVMVYTAEPGAERLALAVVLGTQTLVD